MIQGKMYDVAQNTDLKSVFLSGQTRIQLWMAQSQRPISSVKMMCNKNINDLPAALLPIACALPLFFFFCAPTAKI
jgi:hypothetical protein